ncbi:hypothetical protein CAOG_00158 [Capsaspora owczarzaki ATCC 30864]|uniref:Small ribosomal subunit protein mS41 n=1 Tax=Capsaspora owczarzaki (strain ATCC 30864) TaxID=595528 RepID=A0A0D2WGH2_CAPO3|nr:hypothetical protein CAOG_00158 [Capsaspora owczarzaki ATCC 30864]KJE88510.1 hypothetical protein CAOG_000158 [Capsaspora owczarzaki ATCC 30864]|eukprot:XP_004365029.1 hypothetical protein CAOG_00158 [Capsaspora owczarzaki ATCC 30864]
MLQASTALVRAAVPWKQTALLLSSTSVAASGAAASGAASAIAVRSCPMARSHSSLTARRSAAITATAASAAATAATATSATVSTATVASSPSLSSSSSSSRMFGSLATLRPRAAAPAAGSAASLASASSQRYTRRNALARAVERDPSPANASANASASLTQPPQSSQQATRSADASPSAASSDSEAAFQSEGYDQAEDELEEVYKVDETDLWDELDEEVQAELLFKFQTSIDELTPAERIVLLRRFGPSLWDEGDDRQVYQPHTWTHIAATERRPAQIGLPGVLPVNPNGATGFYTEDKSFKEAVRKSTFTKRIPLPRGDMTVELFLTRIGNEAVSHLAKFPSWFALMGYSSRQMNALGIPIATRRYICEWRDRYSRGVEPYVIKRTPWKKLKDRKAQRIERRANARRVAQGLAPNKPKAAAAKK